MLRRLAIKNKSLENDIQECQDYIDSGDTKAKLAQVDSLEAKKAQVDSYFTRVNNTRVAYDSQPVILGKKFDMLAAIATDVAMKDGLTEQDIEDTGVITYHEYSNGTLSIDIDILATEDMAQKFPADYAEAILDAKDGGKSVYRKVVYTGYNVATEEKTEGEGENAKTESKDMLKLSLSIELEGENSAASDLLADKNADEAK